MFLQFPSCCQVHLKYDGRWKSVEVTEVLFDQAAPRRSEGLLWMWIDEGWILVEGKNLKMTAWLGEAGAGGHKHCCRGLNP